MQSQKFEQAVMSCSQTLLHITAAIGKPLLREWLPNNNHEANTTIDGQGILPIYRAILKHHTEVFRILINNLP